MSNQKQKKAKESFANRFSFQPRRQLLFIYENYNWVQGEHGIKVQGNWKWIWMKMNRIFLMNHRMCRRSPYILLFHKLIAVALHNCSWEQGDPREASLQGNRTMSSLFRRVTFFLEEFTVLVILANFWVSRLTFFVFTNFIFSYLR